MTDMLSDAPFLADNLALDFINTRHVRDGALHDCLTNDDSVMAWLQRAGQWPETVGAAPAGLLTLARKLRESARAVVEKARDGEPGDVTPVNRVLMLGQPREVLEWDATKGAFGMSRQPRDASAESLLAPVAASLAALLTSDRFAFVRQCEAHDCVLLFHDLTKSHRRRWCSMATCGNRMKAAAFRARQKGN